jgi:cobyrinic acid a,c-diamide synthase
MNTPCLVIGATGSGIGKTSVSIGLVRALVNRGLRVQPFKVGPDFLDPAHLALAAGRPCYNLDGWMCGREYVLELFRRRTADADIAIVEGVMGLFDGAVPDGPEGSTAEIACWLGAPVLLIADCGGMARTLAAIVHGFATFDPELRLAGVIANRCGSVHHADLLRQALAAARLPPLLGGIPANAFPKLASRHLGLVAPASGTAATLDSFATAIETHVDIDAMLRLAQSEIPVSGQGGRPDESAASRVTIGIAQDEAFSFYYPDNLEALMAAGACLVPFSPLHDSALPEGLDALYIGGGYPEEQAMTLAANQGMLASIRQFAAAGGAIYAECGGQMYLSQGIERRDGAFHQMAGILPCRTRMTERVRRLGYIEATLTGDCLWGRAGTTLRGHEFHYSEIVDPLERGDWQPAYRLSYRRGAEPVEEGFRKGRILASYAHLHFASSPGAVQAFLEFVLVESRREPSSAVDVR